MDRRRTRAWEKQVDLNDSDETFYEPDLTKHPDEDRDLDLAGTEAVDTYFEQTYNRADGPTVDTDETCFSPAERVRSRDPRPRGGLQLPDTDETFFEPGEAHAAVWQSGPGRPTHRRRPGRSPIPYDSRVVPETPPPPLGLDENPALFDDDHLAGAMGVSAYGFEENPAREESSLFQHELEWSQVCWGRWDLQHEGDGAARDVYVQIPDPVTQELRSFQVPGLRADDPNALSSFTQDLSCWAEQAQQGAAAVKDSAVGVPPADTQNFEWAQNVDMASAMTQDLEWARTQNVATASATPHDTQDLEWTQPQNVVMASDMSHETHDLEWTQTQNVVMASAMSHETQDLEWTQTQIVKLPSDGSQMMDATSADAPEGFGTVQRSPGPSCADSLNSAGARRGPTSSDVQSMEAEAEVVTRPSRTAQANSSSLGSSSDAYAATSMPSFEDDATPPACLRPEDQRNMEEIVVSFRNISFCLEEVEAAAEAMMRVDQDLAAAVPQPEAPLPLPPLPPLSEVATAGPNSVQGQQPSQGPRSPTFHTSHRRRGRPRRPRARATTDPSSSTSDINVQCAARPSAQAPSSPVLDLGRVKASSKTQCKRKRTSQGQQRRSQSAVPTCSPSSPPLRKSRRTSGAPPRNTSTGHAELVPLYTRLQELRFLMQDVIRGREDLPSAKDVSQLTSEVLTIESNIKDALRSETTNKQVQLKREEALQSADKILHQLRVLAEIQENSGTAHESLNNVLETSWSNPASVDVFESHANNHINDSKLYSEGKSRVEHLSKLQDCPLPKNVETLVKENDISGSSADASDYQWSTHIEQSHSEVVYSSIETGTKSLDSQKETNFNESRVKDCHQESDICSNEIDTGNSTFPQDNFLSNETDNILMTKSCSCNCTKMNSLVSDTSIPSNSNLSKSQQKSTHMLTQKGIPESSSPFPDENLRQEITAELQIFDDSNQKPVITDIDRAASLEQRREGEIDNTMSEYQQLVSLIKKCSEISRSHPEERRKVDYTWRGGPLKLKGILLPKSSELTPIDNLPPNFWDDPQAPIPEEWVNMLEWED